MEETIELTLYCLVLGPPNSFRLSVCPPWPLVPLVSFPEHPHTHQAQLAFCRGLCACLRRAFEGRGETITIHHLSDRWESEKLCPGLNSKLVYQSHL